MFSIDYFKYLLRSKKYVLLLILLITLFNSFGSSDSYYNGFHLFITAILCFLVPFSVFYYIHNKKAVDTFFSLPISRKKLLATGLLFSISTIYLSLMISIIVYAISVKMSISSFIFISLLSLLAIVAIVLFNVAIFSLANNSIDGIVILAAYTLFPLFLIGALSLFINNYVAGSSSLIINWVGYLSPSYIGLMMMRKLFPEYIQHTNIQYIKYMIAAIVYILLAIFILKKHFIARKVERADSISDNILTYPFIIFIYMVMTMLVIIADYNFNKFSIFDFFKNSIVVYALLFGIFMSAYFLYKRKLSFNIKLPLIYLVAMILSLIFAQSAKDSRGFGLANNYLKYDENAKYQLSNFQYDDIYYMNMKKDKDLDSYIQKETGRIPQYIEIDIKIGYGYKPDRSTLQMIEDIRSVAIDEFYGNNDENKYNYSTSLNVESSDGQRNYRLSRNLNLNELLDFAKDKAVDVYLIVDENAYQLDSNGKLKIVTMSYYLKYE